MKTRFFIVFFSTFVSFFVTLSILKHCNNPRPPASDTIIQTRLIYTPNDTIEKIRQRYGYIADSVTRWVYDSTWNNVCRQFGDSQTGENCQRILVKKILVGQKDSELVEAYQKKWSSDSTWIVNAIEVDSIKTERIKNLVVKYEQLNTKQDKRKRIGKISHIAAGVFGAVVLLVK